MEGIQKREKGKERDGIQNKGTRQGKEGDPKKGKDDPIVMFGRSKLPVAEQGGGHAAGHAISILGWHCENHPSCDKGSWLIQNSWGHAWGDNGVGWISFTSLDIENQIYFIDVAGVCK